MGKKNAIVIYSWSTIWSMKNKSGAPSFYKTIELYINKGWDVFLILTEASNGGDNIVDKDHLFVLPKWKTDSLISPSNWTKGFLLLKMFRYNYFAKNVTRKIMKNHDNIKLFYAYEIHGVEAARHASLKYQKPLVTRFQGTVATYFKDNLATKIKQYFHLKALRQRADLIIMTDDGTQGLQTLHKLGNQTENIKFWKNGLDILENEYQLSEEKVEKIRRGLGIKSEEIMMLTVSRLQDWKRVDRSIEALAEISKKDKRYKLVIIGDGPEGPKLHDMVIEKNLQKQVKFLGAVEHDKVYDYMISSDIFLSLYDMSNVGNPLLEALTLKKCVVTLNVGDTKTVIKNGENGVLLDVENLSQLPQIIMELGENIEERNKLEKGAEKYSLKNLYSWDKRMEMEYEEILKII